MNERTGRWGWLVTAVAVVVFSWMYLLEPLAQLAGSDGFYSYIYARSLAYDGDIDFTNDYTLCGDPAGRMRDRGGGHPENGFYVGPAVYWTPVLWTLKHVVRLPPATAPQVAGACHGPLAKWTLFLGPLFGALTIYLSYRLSRRVARDGPAALAAGLLGFGSPLVGYATMWPHYAHVYDAVTVALLLVAAVRAWERPASWPRWILVGVLCGVAFLQRPPSALVGAIPFALAIDALVVRGPGGIAAVAGVPPKQWGRLGAVLGILAALGFLVGIVPTALIYKYIFGKWWMWAHPTGNYYMQMGHSHPWLSLFGPNGGLFFLSPVAWLSVFGIPLALRDRRMWPFAAAGLVATAAIVYMSAAALDWDGSASFGARRLTSLVPFFALLAAFLLVRMQRSMKARSSRARLALGVAALVPVAWTVCGDALGNPEGKTTIEHGMTQEQAYGDGAGTMWKLTDRYVGDVAILPAEAVFSLRYGLKMNAFRDTVEAWIVRDYRSMAERYNLPALNDARWDKKSTGVSRTKDGLAMTGRRATLVFASMWPYATECRVIARADRAAKLTVERRGFFGGTTYGTIDLPAGGARVDVKLPVPKGAFDSGLNELVFTTDADEAGVELIGVGLYDTAEYPNPL